MKRTRVGDPGREALKENKPLRTLELGYNPIGAKGAEALAETVKFHSKLTTLRMGWCKITKDGAYYLAVGGERKRGSTSPPRPSSPTVRSCVCQRLR